MAQNPETRLQAQVLVELTKRGCRVYNHTVGVFYTRTGDRIRIGTPGEADIWGVAPGGRAIFLELKMPGKKPRQNQLDFLAAMKSMGAISGWCTSVEEAVRIVEEA